MPDQQCRANAPNTSKTLFITHSLPAAGPPQTRRVLGACACTFASWQRMAAPGWRREVSMKHHAACIYHIDLLLAVLEAHTVVQAQTGLVRACFCYYCSP